MRVQQLLAVLAVTRAAAAAQDQPRPGRSDGRVLDGIVDGMLDALTRLDRCSRRGTATGESVDRCLEGDLARAVEDVTREYGGAEYRINRCLTVEVRPVQEMRAPASGRSPGGLAARLLDLVDALRFRYRPNGVDDVFEGRKKKKGGKKHKMGMMMAAASMGMTVIGGLFMKTMMGGVMMVAIKALIVAKVALLLSAIMAVKKLMHGAGGGGGGVQSTWGGGGGGGTEHGGYRRSYGLTDDGRAAPVADAMAYRDQLQPDSQYGGNVRYTH